MAAPTRSPRGGTAAAGGRPRGLSRLWALVEGGGRGTTSYYMILGSSVALTLIGLLMVLSSSAVEAISKETSGYELFAKQGVWALAGFALMLAMARMPVRRLRRLAWLGYVLAVVLLALVFTPLGIEVYGNRNWIGVGGFTAQPSEAAKLALAVWAGHVLATKAHLMNRTSHVIVPVLFPLGFLVLGAVMAGRDLGTAIILGMILVTALFLAGARTRLFAVAAGAAAIGAVAGPFDSWLALRGIKTLALRMERSQANALELAHRLDAHSSVTRIRYPGLPNDPGHERATAQLKGYGGIISIELESRDAADALVEAVRLWLPATSLGGVESLIERRRRQPGEPKTVPEALVRLSVGIENVEDLWADLEAALSSAPNNG